MSLLSRVAVAVAGACAALSSLGACAPTRGERVAQTISIIAAERTPEKLLERGLAFAQVGDLTRAEQYLVAALDAGASPDAVLPKLLVVCVANAHYRAGISYASPELQRNPDNASLRFVVAELEALTGDAAAAREDLGKVTEAQPADPAPHFAYARLLRDEIGDRAGADREFRAYLSLDPRGEHANEARAFLLKPVAPRAPSPTASPTTAASPGAPVPLPTYVPTPVPIPGPLPADGAEKR
jgi:tetratricopeptide (TPR) repeat protein